MEQVQICIRRALPADGAAAGALAHRLWPEDEPEELIALMQALILQPDAAVYLAEAAGVPVGFAQCQLRREYVEGTHSGPVGYLEGIFVAPEYRRRGLARELLLACEDWARQQGCREFASDCQLENRESLAFHLGSGFAEAERIICFVKQL